MPELSLYAAATGMEAQQINLDVISNNIANVNTTGFKKSRTEFADLLYQNQQAIGGENSGGPAVPTGVQLGNGTHAVSTSRIFTQGQTTQTHGKLDLAIEGDGFFEITQPNGDTAYTRDGAFKLSANGDVVNNAGFLVRGFPQVPAGYTDIYISEDGYMTIRMQDGSQSSTQLQLARFSSPEGLKALGNNLYEKTPASGEPTLGNPRANGIGSVHQGFLELSNVNVVEEMVNMIVAQRAYEINSKSIQTADEMLSRVNQIKR